MTRLLQPLHVLAVLTVCTAVLSAQPIAANRVVAYAPGGGSGVFDSSLSLGMPQSQGGPTGFAGSHVTSLGDGGSLTLGFPSAIVDGPGVDFTVMENGFEFPSGSFMVFSEVALVEVSTNGIDFARMPSSYAGPVGPLPNFGAVAMGSYAGMTGGLPVFADVMMNSLRVDDPTESGGESFDLAELAGHPLVAGALLDLNNIQFVRLVDVQAGQVADSQGVTIWDNGGDPSSADIEAIVGIQHAGNQAAAAPEVQLEVDAQDRVILTISHPNGIGSLNFNSLRATINYLDLSILDLLQVFHFTVVGNELRATSVGPIAIGGFRGVLAFSIEDFANNFSADQLFIQG